MNLDKVAGENGTVKSKETIVLGGRTFIFRKYSLRDVAKKIAWLRERITPPYEVAANALKELLPLKESDPEWYNKKRDEMLIRAAEEAENDAYLYHEELNKRVIIEHNGTGYMLWLGIRRDAPEVTLEQVEEWVDDLAEQELSSEEMQKIMKKINDAASVEGAEDTDPLKAEPMSQSTGPVGSAVS